MEKGIDVLISPVASVPAEIIDEDCGGIPGRCMYSMSIDVYVCGRCMYSMSIDVYVCGSMSPT